MDPQWAPRGHAVNISSQYPAGSDLSKNLIVIIINFRLLKHRSTFQRWAPVDSLVLGTSSFLPLIAESNGFIKKLTVISLPE